MFVHNSTHITYLMTMQLLVGSLLISLLCHRVICDDAPSSSIKPSTTLFPAVDVLPLTSDAASAAVGAAPTSLIAITTLNHLYSTEGPPTTQPSESTGALSKETGHTVTHSPVSSLSIKNGKAFVGQTDKKTTVSSEKEINSNDPINGTSFTNIKSLDSTTSSGSFNTAPTLPPKLVDDFESKTTESVARQENLVTQSEYASSKDKSTEFVGSPSSHLLSTPFAFEADDFTNVAIRRATAAWGTSTIYSEASLSQFQTKSNFQEGVQLGQSSKIFAAKVTTHTETTMEMSDSADQLSSVHSSTHEATASIPTSLTYRSEPLEKEYTTTFMELDLPEMTSSKTDLIQSSDTSMNDQESGELSSTQKPTNLQLTSETATGFQDDSALETTNELTTHGPLTDHKTKNMYDSEILQPNVKTASVFPSTAPTTLFPPGGSITTVRTTTNEFGSTFTGSELIMHTNLAESTSLGMRGAPEDSKLAVLDADTLASTSSGYTMQKTEKTLTFHSLSSPASEQVRKSTDEISEKKLEFISTYTPITFATTLYEKIKSVQSAPSASPSPSVKDETDKSTCKLLQNLPVTAISGDFSKDLSTISKASTTELTGFDYSGTTEIPEVERDQAIAESAIDTEVLKETDLPVLSDSKQESATLHTTSPTVYETSTQPAAAESTKTKRSTDPRQPPLNRDPQDPKDTDPEGMTVATAISMGLILIFLLILFCILAVSLIAGWVHCRGREIRRPKVSLIRVERGLATEFADSWNKGRPAQAWMTTRSGTTMTSHASGAQLSRSISYSPPSSSSPYPPSPPPPSFQCGCKRRGLFGSANRLCMAHGDPSARPNTNAVRAVKIISLTDESDVGEMRKT
ncbi:conserved hypothetical protein [Echinococcus multilocularis]|uniref:Uncharacterized protein n=1 Tax=Echinococcus multilocularis TaxID=6211 RepID=A0A068YJT8_ECHMU|nr:conserved hypothetical protein [Echinococcus multilocularis]